MARQDEREDTGGSGFLSSRVAVILTVSGLIAFTWGATYLWYEYPGWAHIALIVVVALPLACGIVYLVSWTITALKGHRAARSYHDYRRDVLSGKPRKPVRDPHLDYLRASKTVPVSTSYHIDQRGGGRQAESEDADVGGFMSPSQIVQGSLEEE